MNTNYFYQKILLTIIIIVYLLIIIDSYSIIEILPKYVSVLTIVSTCWILFELALIQIMRHSFSSKVGVLATLIMGISLTSLFTVISLVVVALPSEYIIVKRCNFDVYYTNGSFGGARIFEEPSEFPIYVFRPQNMFQEREKTEYVVSVSSFGIRYPNYLCETK